MQRRETKIANSKKYHGRSKLSRSSFKNKLFEVTKEFKEFKLQQNLRIEFTKNYVFKNTIFSTHDLNQKK